MKIRKRLIIMISLFASLLFTRSVSASISLSISPVSGSNSLRFGRLVASEENNIEVRIRINSTDSEQYQVYQRMIEPLTNERGQMASVETIKSYSIMGSNSSGALYLDTMDSISSAQQLIYSSSTTGASDSFTVVYVADGSKLGSAGNYFGKMAFTVRSTGGSSQEVAYLNVFIDSFGEVKASIEESNGRDYIRLESGDELNKEKYLKVSFSGNPGAPIRIYQEVYVFPQNELFDEINGDIVQFFSSGEPKGEIENQVPTDIDRKKTLVYSSKEAEDSFFVNFFIDEAKVDMQKAGNYKGKIQYTVESESIAKEFSFDIEIEIKPVFNMEVTLPPGGMSFEKILPMSPPKVNEVEVSVRSNLGKPYVVVQDVLSPLTNTKGDVFDGKNFAIKVELQEKQKGKVVYDDFQPIPVEANPIFFSDNKGSSSKIKVYYRLRPYENMSAGGYSTNIVYSLGEI